jgi:hypothetical protein
MYRGRAVSIRFIDSAQIQKQSFNIMIYGKPTKTIQMKVIEEDKKVCS